MTMRASREALAGLSNGRFLLGLGVSHPHLVEGQRGHEYTKPVTTMRRYLEGMEKALYLGPPPPEPAPMLLAALRPRMLELAGRMTRGAHPYLVTPEHTARAREVLGEGPWLCPEQMVLLETDAAKARAVARKNMEVYIRAPNYQNSLKWQGFADEDFADGGSDRLVDAIVAWGDEAAIADRIRAHHDAGADHVCIQAFRPDGGMGPDPVLLEVLAPARQ
jgi:probable F420-dependent oxidoreductase